MGEEQSFYEETAIDRTPYRALIFVIVFGLVLFWLGSSLILKVGQQSAHSLRSLFGKFPTSSQDTTQENTVQIQDAAHKAIEDAKATAAEAAASAASNAAKQATDAIENKVKDTAQQQVDTLKDTIQSQVSQ